MIRRTKEEIIASILKNCLFGASKTAIIYKSNSNHVAALPYINYLTKNGLLTLVGFSPITYKTTDKGKEFLNELTDLNGLQ